MNALVLTGGSIKGAFQAGALPVIFEKGYKPDFVWGVSIGALNGAFLIDRAGRAAALGSTPNWQEIAIELREFWRTEITHPERIVRRRFIPKVVAASLWNKFNGLLDTRKLQTLIKSKIKEKNLKKSPCPYAAGVVDMIAGSYFNADLKVPDLLQHVIASTSIPLVMPLVKHKNTWLADGGVRNIAPLRPAIDAGATKVIVIACQAEILEPKSFKPGNPVALAERVVDIMCDETLQNDLKQLKKINEYCPSDGSPVKNGPFKGKRKIPITVIRPEKNPVIDITKFNSKQIKDLIREGELAAQKQPLP